tara:strand:- start:1232 stop:1426 length:195 start_codon:yes stop_codon:yes gene_type:complete
MTSKEKRNHYYIPIIIGEDKQRIESIQDYHSKQFGFKMTKPQAIRCALKHYAEHLNTMEKANDK